MKANTKTIIAIAAVLFVLLTGLQFLPSFHQPAPPPQAANPFGSLPPPVSGMPDISKIAGDQARVFQLMTQYGLDMEAAIYLAQAKAQVLGQTNTSVHILLTLPDGVTSDQTITITPDVKYAPTPAELEEHAKSGAQTYNVKFTVKNESDTKVRMTLQYFVPYSVVPLELQRKIHSQSSAVRWLELVPSAWAQEGGGEGGGMNVYEETALDTAKAYLNEQAEKKGRELSDKFPKPLNSLMLALKALKKGMDFADWMGELDEIEDCAENPTNPLTKKAYDQDPAYEDQVMNGVDEARGAAVESTAMRYMNLGVTSQIGKESEALEIMIGPLSSWTDETLKQLAEQHIKDANKSITPCHHEPMQAGPFRPMKATLIYDYHKITLPRDECDNNGNCSHLEEKRGFECTLSLKPDATGFLVGTGAARVEIKSDSRAHGPNGEGGTTSSESHETSTGVGEIAVRGGGATLQSGVVHAEFHTNALKTDWSSQVGKLPPAHGHNENGAWGMDCDFYNVNFLHGGTFRAFQNSDARGTCSIELSPE